MILSQNFYFSKEFDADIFVKFGEFPSCIHQRFIRIAENKKSEKTPILQQFEVAITIHKNSASTLINERMDQNNLSFHDAHNKHAFFVIPVA